MPSETEIKTTDRKMIVGDLDLAARRCHVIERPPATSRQCWFLAGLLAQQGLTAEAVECSGLNTQACLTKSRASRLIDQFLSEREAA